MHGVRVHTLDLSRGTLVLDGQYLQQVERIAQTAYGLRYSNVIPDHPQLVHVEAHLIPALDTVVSWFTRRTPAESHLYLDMASIETGPEVWTIRDLYLDVTVEADGTPRLEDEDEYAEAVLEGYLTPDEQRRALSSAARVVNGLFAHGNDLAAWLASLGIRLEWWGAATLPG